MSGQTQIRRVHSDQVPIDTLAREVHAYGFSVINDVIEPATCRELAALIETEAGKGPDERPFGSIVERENRFDTPFRAEGVPRRVLAEACRQPVLRDLMNVLVTPDGTLEELSALTSYPGAEDQRFHSDTEFQPDDALLLCVFIALDDVEEDMGPLEIVWKSSRGRAVEEGATVGRMTVGCGDAVVMDSTAAHRGSANRSPAKARPIFYFSFLSPNGPRPLRETYSIVKDPGEAVTLEELLEGSR